MRLEAVPSVIMETWLVENIETKVPSILTSNAKLHYSQLISTNLPHELIARLHRGLCSSPPVPRKRLEQLRCTHFTFLICRGKFNYFCLKKRVPRRSQKVEPPMLTIDDSQRQWRRNGKRVCTTSPDDPCVTHTQKHQNQSSTNSSEASRGLYR